MTTRRPRLLAALVLIAALAACGTGNPASKRDPTVSTIQPTSQKHVQDTVTAVYQRTLNTLPPGYTFDASKYSSTGNIVDCADNAMGDEVSPINYSSSRDMNVPPNASIDGLVEKLGDIWKSFGWSVTERDGFPKPNRFAAAPDGYSIHAIVGRPGRYPPVLNAGSPCYDGKLADKSIQIPVVLRSGGTPRSNTFTTSPSSNSCVHRTKTHVESHTCKIGRRPDIGSSRG